MKTFNGWSTAKVAALLTCLTLPCQGQGTITVSNPAAAEAIAAQTDPAKLATLKGDRAANPRLQRCL